MFKRSESPKIDFYHGGAERWLVLALGLVVMEGAIRKWVIGSEGGTWSYLAYFSKDLAFGAILLCPSLPDRSRSLAIFHDWTIVGGALFLAGAALSSLRGFNPVGALLTLRAGLVLPAVALLAARRLPGIRLERVALLLTLCALINCALGSVQTRLPADHFLNRYALVDSPVIAVETAVRATGTFSYITGLGMMSAVGIWAGIVLLSMARGRGMRLAGIIAIISGFGCGLASLSRGPIVVGCLMLLAWALLSGTGFSAFARSALIWFSVLLLLGGLGFISHFNQLGRAVIERHEKSHDTFAQRAFGQLIESCEAAAVAPFGAGLGTEQVAGNYAASGRMSFTNYETQFPRIIFETGVLGLMGYLVICTGVILALQEARQSARAEGLDAALFATQLLFIPMLYGNVLFNHTASAFVWMIFASVLAGSSAEFPNAECGVRNAEGRSKLRVRRFGFRN